MAHSPRALVLLLRSLGGLDLCALIAVAMPAAWIDAVHVALGLGPFPDSPVAWYLARSASALYSLHGALVLYVSYDVGKYWNLIRFLALATIVHGAVILALDLQLPLPLLWKYGEGPCFAATGAAVLFLQRRTPAPRE